MILIAMPLLSSPSAHPAGDAPPALTVDRAGTNLYARQEEESEVIATLDQGEEMTPLAHAIGKGAWYMVRTKKGAIGWVRSSDIKGGDRLEKSFNETPSIATLTQPPNDPGPILTNGTTVQLQAYGGNVLVPVLLNRSVRVYLIMDTGAALTTVSPAIAQRLQLRSMQRSIITTADGRSSAAQIARLDSVKVGAAEANALFVAVLPAPAPGVEGLLGLDFLSRFKTSIDSRDQTLTLAPR